jgi:hypothetical protein
MLLLCRGESASFSVADPVRRGEFVGMTASMKKCVMLMSISIFFASIRFRNKFGMTVFF